MISGDLLAIGHAAPIWLVAIAVLLWLKYW